MLAFAFLYHCFRTWFIPTATVFSQPEEGFRCHLLQNCSPVRSKRSAPLQTNGFSGPSFSSTSLKHFIYSTSFYWVPTSYFSFPTGPLSFLWFYPDGTLLMFLIPALLNPLPSPENQNCSLSPYSLLGFLFLCCYKVFLGELHFHSFHYHTFNDVS